MTGAQYYFVSLPTWEAPLQATSLPVPDNDDINNATFAACPSCLTLSLLTIQFTMEVILLLLLFICELFDFFSLLDPDSHGEC